MNTRSNIFNLIVMVTCFRITTLSAEVKLPKLISDGMSLRNTQVKICMG
jgi:hypothetical protein